MASRGLRACHGGMQRALCMVLAAGGAPASLMVPWGYPWVGTAVGGAVGLLPCTKHARCLGAVSCLTAFFYANHVQARVGHAGTLLATWILS